MGKHYNDEYYPDKDEWVMTPEGPGKVLSILEWTDGTYAPDEYDTKPRFEIQYRSHSRRHFHPRELKPYIGERKLRSYE